MSKEISVEIKELGITIEPVKTNLAFDFNPAGKTNADETRLWSDGNTRLTVSDNFDWSNGGYQLDEDGDTYFCVKAGTTANISYKLFGDDAKKLGKNFKLVFKTTNVKNYDATALTCLNGGIGLNIQAQKVTLTSEQNSIDLPTCEDDFMEFEFNILPDSQYKEMVLWLDGIPCRVELYDASDNFTQASPVGITIGSPDCDVLVYRMKSYMMNLTDDEILDNFIADAKNAEEMIERYTRNDITDVSGELNPDLLAEKCPDLRIIKISAPTFTTGKKNEVSNTTIQHIYKNGRAVEDNWIAIGSHKGQGTSSNAYGESGRNIDINCSGGFTFGDESTGSKYAFTETALVRSILISKSMLLLLRMQTMLCWQTSLTSSIRTFVRLARTTRKCVTPWHSTPVSFLFRRQIPQMQPSLRMVSGISMLVVILVTQRRIVTPWAWTRTTTRKLSLRLTTTPMHRPAS